MNNRSWDLREDADLNQTQIAQYLGMSQTGYSKYETGENDIPTQVLIKLAKYYKTSIDYILGVSNDKFPYKNDYSGMEPRLHTVAFFCARVLNNG